MTQMIHAVERAAYREASQPARTDQVVSLLRRELALALELNHYLQRASKALHEHVHTNVATLPRNLQRDLMAEELRLAERLETLSPGSARMPDTAGPKQAFWALFAEDDTDPRSHLEALVVGYARFMRSTSEIEASLKILADPESLQVLQSLETVGNRGLWFLEIYLEGLALHMDGSHLPQWPESAVSA